jgi:mannose-6-phosphate isomerase-like protein (cupin superfamily)
MIRNQEPGVIRVPGDERAIDSLGVRVRITAADTGGISSAMVIAHDGPGGPPLHVHRRYDEMFCVLEGEYRFHIGEAVEAAPAGTMAYARRGTPHTYACTVSPGRLLSVATPGGLEEYLLELDQLISEGASEDALACLHRAWATEIVGPGLTEL